MSNLDLTAMTPAQIDTAWFQALQPALQIDQELKSVVKRIKQSRGAGYQRSIDYLEDRKKTLTQRLADARQVEQQFNDEYERRGGWTRFLLVANANGHLHRSTGACRTLRPGETFVVPVPEFSGMTDQQVVDAACHQACSVCFPNAPVLTREDRDRVKQENAQKKQAEREQKRQEKLAKQAVRARKLLAKVEATYEQLGGRDHLLALPPTGPESPYGLLVGSDVQVSVQNVILDDVREAHGEYRFNTDPRTIITEVDNLDL